MNDSGKSQKNNLLRKIINEGPSLPSSAYLGVEESRLHRNWHERRMEISLDEQERIEPLGY